MELEEPWYEPDSEEMEVDTRLEGDRQDGSGKTESSKKEESSPAKEDTLAGVGGQKITDGGAAGVLQGHIHGKLGRGAEEQWSLMTGEMVFDTGLEVKASWNPNLATQKLTRSGEMVGKGNVLS